MYGYLKCLTNKLLGRTLFSPSASLRAIRLWSNSRAKMPVTDENVKYEQCFLPGRVTSPTNPSEGMHG